MRKRRQQYSAEFKAKVALETIKGARTVNEIAAHYEVHPTQVAQWKSKHWSICDQRLTVAAKPASGPTRNCRTRFTSRSASSK